MKYTSVINETGFNELLAKYKNRTLTNNEWSQMTPALRKRIKRQSK